MYSLSCLTPRPSTSSSDETVNEVARNRGAGGARYANGDRPAEAGDERTVRSRSSAASVSNRLIFVLSFFLDF